MFTHLNKNMIDKYSIEDKNEIHAVIYKNLQG